MHSRRRVAEVTTLAMLLACHDLVASQVITDTQDYAVLVDRASNRKYFNSHGLLEGNVGRGNSTLLRLKAWQGFSQASFEWNITKLRSSGLLITSKLFVAGGVVWTLWLDLDSNSTRARHHGRDTVGVMLAASWAASWHDDEAVAVSVRLALPNTDRSLPGRVQVPPDVAATLTRNASGMWAADLNRGLLERGLLGGGEASLLLRVHLLNITVGWREEGKHPEARYSRAIRQQVSAALGADSYGVRQEFEAAVWTSVVDGPEGEAHSQYQWKELSYNSSVVGELLWYLVYANLRCHGLDEHAAQSKIDAVVGMCDISVGRVAQHSRVRVVVSPYDGAVRYLDEHGEDLKLYGMPCKLYGAAVDSVSVGGDIGGGMGGGSKRSGAGASGGDGGGISGRGRGIGDARPGAGGTAWVMGDRLVGEGADNGAKAAGAAGAAGQAGGLSSGSDGGALHGGWASGPRLQAYWWHGSGGGGDAGRGAGQDAMRSGQQVGGARSWWDDGGGGGGEGGGGGGGPAQEEPRWRDDISGVGAADGAGFVAAAAALLSDRVPSLEQRTRRFATLAVLVVALLLVGRGKPRRALWRLLGPIGRLLGRRGSGGLGRAQREKMVAWRGTLGGGSHLPAHSSGGGVVADGTAGPGGGDGGAGAGGGVRTRSPAPRRASSAAGSSASVLVRCGSGGSRSGGSGGGGGGGGGGGARSVGAPPHPPSAAVRPTASAEAPEYGTSPGGAASGARPPPGSWQLSRVWPWRCSSSGRTNAASGPDAPGDTSAAPSAASCPSRNPGSQPAAAEVARQRRPQQQQRHKPERGQGLAAPLAVPECPAQSLAPAPSAAVEVAAVADVAMTKTAVEVARGPSHAPQQQTRGGRKPRQQAAGRRGDTAAAAAAAAAAASAPSGSEPVAPAAAASGTAVASNTTSSHAAECAATGGGGGGSRGSGAVPARPPTPPHMDSLCQLGVGSSDVLSARPSTLGSPSSCGSRTPDPDPDPEADRGPALAGALALAGSANWCPSSSSASGPSLESAATPSGCISRVNSGRGGAEGATEHQQQQQQQQQRGESSAGGCRGSGGAAAAQRRPPMQPWSLAVLAAIAGETARRREAPLPPRDFTCLSCRDGPREHGFLHGAVVHVGLCGDCASRMVSGEGPLTCLVCRQPVDKVVEVVL